MYYFLLVQNMEHVPGVPEIIQTVEKLKDLEQRMLLKTQNELARTICITYWYVTCMQLFNFENMLLTKVLKYTYLMFLF